MSSLARLLADAVRQVIEKILESEVVHYTGNLIAGCVFVVKLDGSRAPLSRCANYRWPSTVDAGERRCGGRYGTRVTPSLVARVGRRIGRWKTR